MKKIIETERLILRPFEDGDAPSILEFGGNPDVIRYTGDQLITTIEEAQNLIDNVWKVDYATHGYGRFAVIYKPDNRLIGFSGLKYEHLLNGTDIGYRFLPQYWGMGIATESCWPVLDFGFNDLQLQEVLGLAYPVNNKSCKVLEKIGMTHYKTEPFPGEHIDCNWYRLSKVDYGL